MQLLEEEHDNAVEVLLRAGADSDRLDLHRSSALSLAAELGKPDLCKRLIPITGDINSQDGDGDTALSNAATSAD